TVSVWRPSLPSFRPRSAAFSSNSIGVGVINATSRFRRSAPVSVRKNPRRLKSAQHPAHQNPRFPAYPPFEVEQWNIPSVQVLFQGGTRSPDVPLRKRGFYLA